MPIVTGPITLHGAVIDVLVGVPAARRRALTRVGFAVPPAVGVRAVIDTGAAITGFTHAVFAQLGLTRVGQVPISTPSTPTGCPYPADQFYAELSLIAGGTPHVFAEAWVIAADGFYAIEEMHGLIGRDVLDHCSFDYRGVARLFEFAF